MSTRHTETKQVAYCWQLEENQHAQADKGKVVASGEFSENATFSYASGEATDGKPLRVYHTRGKQTAHEQAEAYLEPRSLMDKATWRKWNKDGCSRWRSRLYSWLGAYTHVLRIWVKE